MSRLTEDHIYQVTWDADWLRNTAFSDDGHKIFTRIADTIKLLLAERKEQAERVERLRKVAGHIETGHSAPGLGHGGPRVYHNVPDSDHSREQFCDLCEALAALHPGDMGEPTDG